MPKEAGRVTSIRLNARALPSITKLPYIVGIVAEVLRAKDRIDLGVLWILGVPKNVVGHVDEVARAETSRLPHGDKALEVLCAQYFIENVAGEMHVLIADLNEEASGRGEQLSSNSNSIAQVCQVGVNA